MSTRCPVEYVRPGGRQPGDRIVKCQRSPGHVGPHEEAETGVTWTSAEVLHPALVRLPGWIADELAAATTRADRMEPVVEAARAWYANGVDPNEVYSGALSAAIEAYEAEVERWTGVA
jgi:hypothetical protein